MVVALGRNDVNMMKDTLENGGDINSTTILNDIWNKYGTNKEVITNCFIPYRQLFLCKYYFNK